MTAQPANAATALATRRENGGIAKNSLADQIRSMEKEFQLAMPKGTEATQLIRDALTAVRMTKNLDKCDGASVLGALMTCAQLGLRPGVLGHAWVLPFWDRKANDGRGGHKAQLVIGYQGYIDLAHRSPKVSSIIARTAYENDVYDVQYGIADTIIHKPNLDGDRGRPRAYYAIVKYVSGGYAFFDMSHADMLKYRDENATAKTREGKVFGPWVDNFEGMAQKTTIRQLAKFMPKSTELAAAIAADEGIRVDLRPNVRPEDATEYVDVMEGEVVEPNSGPPATDGQPAGGTQ